MVYYCALGYTALAITYFMVYIFISPAALCDSFVYLSATDPKSETDNPASRG